MMALRLGHLHLAGLDKSRIGIEAGSLPADAHAALSRVTATDRFRDCIAMMEPLARPEPEGGGCVLARPHADQGLSTILTPSRFLTSCSAASNWSKPNSCVTSRMASFATAGSTPVASRHVGSL